MRTRTEIQADLDRLLAELNENDREGEGGEREREKLRYRIATLEKELGQAAA